jgi:branched-chain amino acid transport system permease protein
MKTLKGFKQFMVGTGLPWWVFALVLIFAPVIFNKGASLSILSYMGIMIIFGLSFNMLLGQGGMLSFGHAVYAGLGAFFAVHAMNLAGNNTIPIPVTLIPLVGGFAGLFFGMVFGYVTTKKSGTTFAMITLGICELVHSSSLMFPGFFGGEGGITTNRVIGAPFHGISFGPQIQVYYLIAFWLLVSAIAMYAYTQTPLGKMINAVRDNPERAEFVGYNTQWVRYLTLAISAFFAGISGGLSAINVEIVSAENVSLTLSANVLLFTFIGGSGYFFGPVIGAVIGVLLTVVLSDYTKAWQLYLGLFFIFSVMCLPGGVAHCLMQNIRLIRYRQFVKVWRLLIIVLAFALLALCGFAAIIEMLYHRNFEADGTTGFKFFFWQLDTASPIAWIAAGMVLVIGLAGVRFLRTNMQSIWSNANLEIERLIQGERV